MIKLLIGNKKLYQFRDTKQAAQWIKSNPSEYEYDLDNLQMYMDEPLPDMPLLIEEDIQHDFHCRGCNSHLMFTRKPSETSFQVTCPHCDTTHNIKVHGDASAS